MEGQLNEHPVLNQYLIAQLFYRVSSCVRGRTYLSAKMRLTLGHATAGNGYGS